MAVVCDASPLSYLVLIDLGQMLPQIFGHIHIPTAVAEELAAADGPRKTREWALALPSWVEVKAPVAPSPVLDLHEGERQAISLALELKAERLIIDERAGPQGGRIAWTPDRGNAGYSRSRGGSQAD